MRFVYDKSFFAASTAGRFDLSTFNSTNGSDFDVVAVAKVDSVSVPGVNGEFQMLNNHAPIVSNLKAGTVKIHVHTQEHLELHCRLL